MAFLARLGAGDIAEEILHEIWMRLPKSGAVIQSPKNYLYRMAHHVLIDWERSKKEARKRDAHWADLMGTSIHGQSEQPAADRVLEARQMAMRAFEVIHGQGERAAKIFTRHRLDGLTQRQVAAELGISVGTVEGDLRRVYRALVSFREGLDKA